MLIYSILHEALAELAGKAGKGHRWLPSKAHRDPGFWSFLDTHGSC